MGKILNDVKDNYLPRHDDQRDMLKPFLHGFDITYAEEVHSNNTIIFIYLLKPEKHMEDSFGFSREMVMAYSQYDEFQPRALQAINSIFEKPTFKNRVDTLNCFVISKDPNVIHNAGVVYFEGNWCRSIIPIVYNDVIENKNDAYYIRNKLRENLYGIDLFGNMLPLKDDTSFFGRQRVVARYVDSVKRVENRGLFGLRKTGKTSLLFKIQRVIEEQNLGKVLYYDCKDPSYRNLHYYEFLSVIAEDISNELEIQNEKASGKSEIIKKFKKVIRFAYKKGIKIVIMFDEIEYISFNSITDEHWKNEFIDFWQIMWSVQSTDRNLMFILSGVNSSISETDVIGNVQNPLFSIVEAEYLQGLEYEDAKNMIRTLGKRMGLDFEYDAIDLLYNQYNGHPMLMRLACSYINKQYTTEKRPIDITKQKIERIQDDIDVELSYYFKHVVSEIELFYKDEYDLFGMLASGQRKDFIECSELADSGKHLYDYGLVAKDKNGKPYVKLPVAGRYVAMQLAKKENRTSLYKIVERDKRANWIKDIASSILRDFRQLEVYIQDKKMPSLFGDNSFPEADKFSQVKPVEVEDDFDRFINVCNRCFVESIKNYGKSVGNDGYLDSKIKENYPSLYALIDKIRTYRNKSDHLKLTSKNVEKYRIYWNEDTKGIHEIDGIYFAVQQKLLEDLLEAIHDELDI